MGVPLDVTPWLDAAGHMVESVTAFAGLLVFLPAFAIFVLAALVFLMITDGR